jgi:hypothetical protein
MPNQKEYSPMNIEDLNTPYLGGPRSSEGKEKSSQNFTKHSLCANNVRFVKDGEEDIYKSIEATWFNSYQPRDEAEKHLVRQLTDADFHLDRAAKTMAEVEAHIYEYGNMPINWSDDNHYKLARITRYHTSRNNAVIKARKAIEDYRKNRTNEVRSAEKHDLYKRKYMGPLQAIELAAEEWKEFCNKNPTLGQPSPPPPIDEE